MDEELKELLKDDDISEAEGKEIVEDVEDAKEDEESETEVESEKVEDVVEDAKDDEEIVEDEIEDEIEEKVDESIEEIVPEWAKKLIDSVDMLLNMVQSMGGVLDSSAEAFDDPVSPDTVVVESEMDDDTLMKKFMEGEF